MAPVQLNFPVLQADLSGKTVMVIGANGGVGLEAVKHFAGMNPTRLIVTCRSEQKCEDIIAGIEKDTSYAGVEAWPLELSDFGSVEAFVEQFERDGRQLDIVVANAGVALDTYGLTKDGWETSLQVNHLSGALLSFLLIPHLLRTAKAKSGVSRLIIVASVMHSRTDFRKARIPGDKILKTLNDKDFCTEQEMKNRYSDSKLLNVLFTRALASHVPTSAPLIVSAVTPGLCHSGLLRNVGTAQFAEVLKNARTAEEGSRQLIWAAVGPNPESGRSADELRGAFVLDTDVRQPSEWVLSKEGKDAQERLWTETLNILTKVDSRVGAIVESLRES